MFRREERIGLASEGLEATSPPWRSTCETVRSSVRGRNAKQGHGGDAEDLGN